MKKEGVKQTQFLSEASKRWNSLPPENKQKYVEMAQKQKDAYNLMKAQIPENTRDDIDGDGALPEDEANQLRSKTHISYKLFREVHVATDEPYQTDMLT